MFGFDYVHLLALWVGVIPALYSGHQSQGFVGSIVSQPHPSGNGSRLSGLLSHPHAHMARAIASGVL